MPNRSLKRLLFEVSSLMILLFTVPVLSQQKEDIKLRAQEFVDSHESRLQNEPNLSKRSFLLAHLASAALAAGDNTKAEKYALELQSVGDVIKAKSRFDWGTPTYATHVSNIILGLIAFDENKFEDAKAHLLAAAQFNGKPDALLTTFGPNMLLARKLLERGEKETVIQYLEDCGRFWRLENGRLDKWKSIIKQDAIPDFEGNLTVQVGTWKVVS